MIRRTPYLRMEYFGTGQGYSVAADILRLQAIENSLDVAMKVTGGGVINGWNVFQSKADSIDPAKKFIISIEPGFGIIPIDANASFPRTFQTSAGALTYNVNTPDPHYFALKTNKYVELPNPSVGKTRISNVYISLNLDYINKFEALSDLDISNSPVFEITTGVSVTISTEKNRADAFDLIAKYYDTYVIYVSPDPSRPAAEGYYRNLIPQSSYPINIYKIDGKINFNVDNTTYTVFVNGMKMTQGFQVASNDMIVFDNPLSDKDFATVELSPKHGFILATVETDDNGIVKIDNSVRLSVYEKFGDSFIEKALRAHVHDGVSASNIVLTTETSLIDPASISANRKIFVFNKNLPKYGFDFNANTYRTEAYVDGLFCLEPYTITDDDTNKTLSIVFSNAIASTSTIKLKLIVRDEYTQVQNSLSLSQNNPNIEKIDINVDASNLSGQLNGNRIPKLSHVGLVEKPLMPCNSTEEWVLRTETFDLDDKDHKEFFPVSRDKINARDASFLFKDSERNVLYACASGTILSRIGNSYSKDITGEYPYGINANVTAFFNDGWTPLEQNGATVSGDKISEYGKPLRIYQIEDDFYAKKTRNFVCCDKYVNALYYENGKNIVSEVIDLSGDGTGIEMIPVTFGSISGSCFGPSFLNFENTVYLLADDKVYAYEYSEVAQKPSLFDITSTPVWANSSNIFKAILGGKDYLFVSTTDGHLYVNYLSFVKLSSGLTIGDIEVKGAFSTNNSPFALGDSVILSASGMVSENKTVTREEVGKSYFYIDPVQKNGFMGLGSHYNTVAIKDWEDITRTGTFESEIKQIVSNEDYLFVLTDSNIYFVHIYTTVNVFDSMAGSWTKVTTGLTGLNDICFSGTAVIIAGDAGIYRSTFTGSFSSFIASQNSGYGTSLNTMLFPAYSIYLDTNNVIAERDDVLYVCGKYGIFRSEDAGVSWRNTLQSIGHPINNTNSFVNQNKAFKIIGKYNKRIYVDIDVSTVAINDYVYAEPNSSSKYKNTPLRIIGTGIDSGNGLAYLDTEEFSGYQPDMNSLFLNQNLSIYRYTEPLAIIDNIPQNSNYTSETILPYTFDYYRQSILFGTRTDVDSEVQIASRYKNFKLVEDFDLSSRTTGISLLIGGNTISNWTKTGNVFTTDSWFNIDVVPRLTVSGFISNVGVNTHTSIEDIISKEDTGLSYGFDAVRTSDFLSLLFSVKNYFSGTKTIDELFGNFKYTYIVDYQNSALDLASCFIENLPAATSQNSDAGETTLITSYLYADGTNLYAGTNSGIWEKTSALPVFKRLGTILDTLDATGYIDVPHVVNGAYIQFNADTDIWTVTWGAGVQEKDENNGFNKYAINSIACCPGNNIVLASADSGVFRSLDAGDNWVCIWNTKADARTKVYPKVINLVFDDIHPWVVNAVLRDGLYRSFNYGERWELVSKGNIYGSDTYGCFTYLKEDTDNRTSYLFFQNSLNYKPAHFTNELGPQKINSSYRSYGNGFFGDVYISSDSLFRQGIGGERISSVVNSKLNGNIFASSHSGVYCSHFFDYNPETYTNLDNSIFKKSFGSPSSKINFFNNGVMGFDPDDLQQIKSQAFMELNDSYLVFVDYENIKTYISLVVDPALRTIPADGDLVGYYVAMNGNSSRKYFKIVGNYNRGPEPGEFYYEGYYGEKLNKVRIELVLEGTIESGHFTEDYSIVETVDPDSRWMVVNGNSSRMQDWLYLSLFGKKNGRVSNVLLNDINSRVYAVKENLFNSEKDETVFIIHFEKDLAGNFSDIPGFMFTGSANNPTMIDNALVGYCVGSRKQGEQYAVYASKKITALNSDYYVNDSNVIQYACRMESENFNFTDLNDPVDLWLRMNHAEMHNSEPFICRIYDNASDVSGHIVHYSQLEFSDVFTSGHKEDVVWVGVKSSITASEIDDPEWTLIPADLIGKYIGNSAAGTKYKILDAIEDDAGAAFTGISGIDKKFYLRVAPYSRSYSDQISIYSDNLIASVTSSSITLTNYGSGLPDLSGFFVKASESGIGYLVDDITLGTINFENTNIDSVFESGDKFVLDYGIQENNVNFVDIYRNGNNENIYAATSKMVYQSQDDGETWRSINTGLTFNTDTNKASSVFSKIKVIGSALYGCSDHGLFVYSTDTWSAVNDSNTYNLSDFKVYDVDKNTSNVVIAATSEGIYYLDGTWEKATLPEDNVTAVHVQDSDRIWIGTNGHGLYSRIGDEDWIQGISPSDEGLVSSNWMVRNIYFEENKFKVSSVAYSLDSNKNSNVYFSKYVSADSEITGFSDLFDWEKTNSNILFGEYPFISSDPSHYEYLTRFSSSLSNKNSSPAYHNLVNFSAGVFGFGHGEKGLIHGHDILIQPMIDNYAINPSYSFSAQPHSKIDVYENPFSHLPDRSSVTSIKESGNYILFGTDRNGIWRSKKNSYILPALTGGFDNYGYDISSVTFEADTNQSYVDGVKSTGCTKKFSLNGENGSFFTTLERFYVCTVTASPFYTAVQGFSSLSDLVGAYFVISDEISQSFGFSGTKKVFEITNIYTDGSDYKIRLTAGKIVQDPSRSTDTGRWTTDLDFASDSKFCLLDFAKYENISSGLPTLPNIKNSNGAEETGLFIRDIYSSGSAAMLACGINGIYISSTVSQTNKVNVVWTKWTSADAFVYDATCIAYDSANSDYYVGTWGDGVFKIKFNGTGGITAVNTGLNHKKIWAIHFSAENKLYVGTEHGGVYGYSAGTWAREGAGDVEQSKIGRSSLIWKTIGVPTTKISGFDYSESNKIVSYSFGGGVLTAGGGPFTAVDDVWQQNISGLENMYVQSVAICATNSDVAYAATCGGGVFRNSRLFESDSSWTQLSTAGLPSTLNIDQVVTGTDPNIVYINARINDISLINAPYWMRKYAGVGQSPNLDAVSDYSEKTSNARANYVDNLYSAGLYYLPLTPYANGDRKHVVYKGVYTDGDVIWTRVYDSDPNSENTNYQFASMVYGLSFVPGYSDNVRFLYKYADFWGYDSGLKFNDHFDYVSISGTTISRKVMSVDGKPDDFIRFGLSVLQNSGNPSEAVLSIDPYSHDTVYLSTIPYDANSTNYVIFRTDNDGDTWTDISPGGKAGFNSAIQISTTDPYELTLTKPLTGFAASYDGTEYTSIVMEQVAGLFVDSTSAISGCFLYFDDDTTGNVISNNFVIDVDGTNYQVYQISGNFVSQANSANTLNIVTERTIYSNFNNNLYASVNKGNNWVKVTSSGDIFHDPSMIVMGAVNNPINSISDNSVTRSKYVLVNHLGLVRLFEQDNSAWTEILIPNNTINTVDFINPENLLNDCLRLTYDGSVKTLYITEKNRINKVVVGGTRSYLIESASEIQFPLTISKFDSTKMCFVASDTLYFGDDGFISGIDLDNSQNLEFSGNDIKSITLGTGSDTVASKEAIICVNRKNQRSVEVRASFAQAYVSGNTNSIFINYSSADKFEPGYLLSFSDVSSSVPYKCKVVSAQGYQKSNIGLPQTINFKIVSGAYDASTNKTTLRIDSAFGTSTDYVGSSLGIFWDSAYSKNYSVSVFNGAVLVNGFYEISVDGDVLSGMTNFGIDFISAFMYARIGCLGDILPAGFAGSVIAKNNDNSDKNGLWYSSANGIGIKHIISNTLSQNNFQFGADDAFVFGNGAISVLMSDGSVSNIFTNTDSRNNNGTLNLKNWTKAFFSKDISLKFFAENNDETPLFGYDQYSSFISNYGTFSTGDAGLTWTLSRSSGFKADYVLPIYNEANSFISSYHLIGNNDFAVLSSAQYERSSTFVSDTNPYIANTSLGSPTSLWLSESNSGFAIYADIFNSNAIENLVNVVKINFSNRLAVSSIDPHGPESGISVQSIYCFDEENGFIYAGGKDNVAVKNIANSYFGWRIIPYNNDIFDSPQAFTSIKVQNNAGYLNVSGNKALYSTRTSLNYRYSEGSTANQYIVGFLVGTAGIDDSEVFDFNPGDSHFRYMFDSGMMDVDSQSSIARYDRTTYRSYKSQEFLRDVLSGHRGALGLINNSVFVGGFDNSIFLFPFTCDDETFDNSNRNHLAINSGRRDLSYSGLPITNENNYVLVQQNNENNFLLSEPSFNYYGDIPPSGVDVLLRPKASWCVDFSGTAGYCAVSFIGENSRKKNYSSNSWGEAIYHNIHEYSNSVILKTNDNGMFWQPVMNSNDTWKNMIVTGIKAIDNDLLISSNYGKDSSSFGLFKFDENRTWSQYSFADYNSVPVSDLKTVNGSIFAIANGFGLYIVDADSVDKYESRFDTYFGLNNGNWIINDVDEDPINPNRLIAGTKNNGIVETLNALDAEPLWKFDNNGIPYGNVSKVKILPKNNTVVLAGLKDNGLFRKDSQTGSYVQILSGLTADGEVKEITVDEKDNRIFTIVDVSDMVFTDNIFITRTPYVLPSFEPENGTNYDLGETFYNTEVIYDNAGSDFENGKYKDSTNSLKYGTPYCYKFYNKDSGNNYTVLGEMRGTILNRGKIGDPDSTTFYTNGTPLSGNLKDRIVDLGIDFMGPDIEKYVIDSNTNNSLDVLFDMQFRRLNVGNIFSKSYNGKRFKVQGAKYYKPVDINPIYMVFKEKNSNGSIKVSYDNGFNWNSIAIDDLDVQSMSVSYSSDKSKTIFVATNQSILKTTDDGATWDVVSMDVGSDNFNGLPNISNGDNYVKVFVDEQDSSIVYALTKNGKIYRTANGIRWFLVNDSTKAINTAAMVSDFTNSIYIASEDYGLLRFDDSVRDFIDVSINADSQITYFGLDYVQFGDTYHTDSDSISLHTISKNDDPTDNRQQIRFSLDENSKFLSFKFIKNNKIISSDDIFIGDTNTAALSDPFVLQNPNYRYGNLIVNKIGSIFGKLFILTNLGSYISNGDKWNKIQSAVLPKNVYNIEEYVDADVLIGSDNGLWLSHNGMTAYRSVESTGKKVKAIWSNNVSGTEYIYRGGEEGLWVTIKNSRSIVVYSGNKRENVFAWGNPFDLVDGGWSEVTKEIISDPIYMPIDVNGDVLGFMGWDGALIVRKGPYATIEEVLAEEEVWKPSNFVKYPDNSELLSDYAGHNGDAVFGTTDSALAVGNKTIIVGNIPNRRGNLPGTPITQYYIDNDILFDSGPTTQFPIIDRDNRLDLEEYYIYKAYPWINVPDPDSGYASSPYYYPANGDTPDYYSCLVSIDKFSGSSVINCGITVDNENNWVVGTDNGIFYSTSKGTIVNPAERITGFVSSLIKTAANILIASVVSYDGNIQVIKTTDNVNWEPINQISEIFFKNGVNHVFNIVGFDNIVFLSTNAGVFCGEVDGTNWKAFSGSIGNSESLSDSKVLGQGFLI